MSRGKRRYAEKKSKSTEAVVDASVGFACIIANFVMLVLAAGVEESLGNVFGGISFLCMLVSIVVLVRGSREYKNENFDKTSRIFGVAVPAIATTLWILLYITGIFMG